MKRVMYLFVAALVSTMVLAPAAAAQGENLQQLQQALQQARQQAQDNVQQAQQYMESPEGQQTLQQAQENLQQAGQQLQQAREGVQKAVQERTVVIEQTAPLPPSGGAGVGALAAPAAALLVG